MKKTEFVTFRTDQGTKQTLDELAVKKRWTVSFLVEEIVKDWLRDSEEKTREYTQKARERGTCEK